MKDERILWVVMSLEEYCPVPSGEKRDLDPAGFLPVFSTEEAAKAYAGGRFTVSAVRLKRGKS